jgi:hypothetical protein
MNINDLVLCWSTLKNSERVAADSRRKVEDDIVKFYRLNPQEEGTKNFKVDGYKLKIVNRFNRKIDSDKLQEVAAENGLSGHLSGLFRWKPEINPAAWKGCSKDITDILSVAITTAPGRPSFLIEPTTTKEQ